MWKNESRVYLFLKEGFFLNDRGRSVNRKRKPAGWRDDPAAELVIVEVKARASQRRPYTTYELMIPLHVMNLKKSRGKNTKVVPSTAELTRRLDAFERDWDSRFKVLLKILNQLMRSKVPKGRRARKV